MVLGALLKRSYILLIALLFTFAVQGQQQTVRLLTPHSKTKRIGEHTKRLVDYLESNLDVHVEYSAIGNIRRFAEALNSNEYDLVYASPFYYSLAKNRGGGLEPLVAYADEDGEPSVYYSCIIASKRSGIKSLEDLIERADSIKFKFSKPSSTSGHLIPRLHLAAEGIHLPELFFKNVKFSDGHSRLRKEVSDGTVDAGACSCSGGKPDQKNITTIWISPPIIRSFFATTNHIDKSLKKKVRQTLLGLHNEASAEVYQEIVESHPTAFKSFIPITEEPMKFMIRSMDDINDLLFFINYYQDQLTQQQDEIRKGDERLEEQKVLLSSQQATLEDQLIRIENQSTLLYLSLGAIFLTLVAVVFFYQNFKKRKSLSERLEEKAREFEAQNTQLKELMNYKQGLTHMIAHDMKTPLNVVLGLTEKTPDEEKTKEIHQSGKLMQQMVTNMLDVQKYEQKKMPVRLESTNLKKLVNLSKHYMEFLMTARNIHFSEEVSDEIHVNVDSDIFMRVLTNLFSNAVKYNPVGGKLTVQAQQVGQRIKIEVSDSGKGIHSDDQPFIFDKFWQVDSKKSGRIQSTGLGLTFCKMAMEAHGQTIEVASEVGVGSTFTLYLEGAHLDKNIKPTEKTKPQVEKLPNTLSPDELQQIDALIDRIKGLPLYKYSQITKELRSELDSPVVEEWKSQIIQAASTWDHKLFEKLISINEHELSAE